MILYMLTTLQEISQLDMILFQNIESRITQVKKAGKNKEITYFIVE